MTDTLTATPMFVVPEREREDRLTLPDFCTVCLNLQPDSPTRRAFVDRIDAKCSRIEQRGGNIEYPLRLSRFAWYAEWELFEHEDERQTQLDARS